MKKLSNIIGFVLCFLGVFLIVLKGFIGDSVDANGILHEAFFLIPIGYLCLLIGIIVIVITKFIKK